MNRINAQERIEQNLSHHARIAIAATLGLILIAHAFSQLSWQQRVARACEATNVPSETSPWETEKTAWSCGDGNTYFR